MFEFYDTLKPVVARFDQTQASTDGGVVWLKAVDDRLRVTDQLAACLVDRRDPEKIRHSVRDLLRQRLFGLACGYEDANDAARLADDPLHKLAVGRDPVTGAALASQPTLSRFEHAVGPWALARMGRTLATTVIAHHRERLEEPGPAHHHRSGPDRRSDAWAAGVHLLQRARCHLVLSAAGGHADVQ